MRVRVLRGVSVGYDPSGTLFADLSQATAVTINAIRVAFQVQKLLERDARGGTRYTEIIRSHFGVVSPDSRLQRPKCQPILIAQVKLFSTDPVLFMEVFGKATGVCCICGRLLTNEWSVERGIGPICAENYGL